MKNLFAVLSISGLLLLSGCASYHAAPLSDLSPNIHQLTLQKDSDILVTAKPFNKADCEVYLDRNIIKKGFQPLQISIQNNSDKDYQFSPENLGLPLAHDKQVRDKAHTSTFGRIAGYSAGALVIWPLVIPAIADGINSKNSNKALDSDYHSKIARESIITSGSHYNKLVFVPIKEYKSRFILGLVDVKTGSLRKIPVVANQIAEF